MSEIKTGGPAFPTMSEARIGENTWQFEGMTLLDYFAAKAMQGMLSKGLIEDDETLAGFSYAVARKMIAERNK